MLDYLHVGNAFDLADPHDRRLYRILEVFPGFLAWSTLAVVVLVSFKAPVFATFFIILFDIYWLIKTIYLSVLTRSSFLKMRHNLKVDWTNRLASVPENPKLQGIGAENIFNLIILPAYKEPYSIVRDSLNAN